MFQPLPIAAQAVSFIGAGLSMVAHGACAAVGLVQEGAPAACATPQPPAAQDPHPLGQCIGHRLEAYRHRGG